jgi:hypothetical protein
VQKQHPYALPLPTHCPPPCPPPHTHTLPTGRCGGPVLPLTLNPSMSLSSCFISLLAHTHTHSLLTYKLTIYSQSNYPSCFRSIRTGCQLADHPVAWRQTRHESDLMLMCPPSRILCSYHSPRGGGGGPLIAAKCTSKRFISLLAHTTTSRRAATLHNTPLAPLLSAPPPRPPAPHFESVDMYQQAFYLAARSHRDIKACCNLAQHTTGPTSISPPSPPPCPSP